MGSQSSIEIRQASLKDLRPIMRLANRCILDLAGTKRRRIFQVISDRIKLDLTLYPRTCLVASNGRGLVGFSLTEATGSYASIFLLAVNPQYRRRGVGSALVSDTLNRLVDEEVEYVELMTSLENESAQSFWMRQGFTDAKMKVFSRVSRRRNARRQTQAFKLEEDARAKGR